MPSAISALASVSVVSAVPRVKVKSPVIETPATPIVTPSPVTRSEVPASRLSVVSKPPSVNVSSTWRPVVLISSANAPPSVTPGTFCSATVPLRRPATPPVAPRSRISVPVPLVSVSRSCVPSPRPKATLASVSLTAAPLAVVSDSTARSPVIRWPATRSVTPVASKRRYGPAGRSPTAAAVVLSARPKLPESSKAEPALTAIAALRVTGDAGGAEDDRRR